MDVQPYEQRLRQDRIWGRQQADSFFMRVGPVYQALEDLTRRLEEARISYALVGALALREHGLNRETVNVNILVTKEGLAAFRERYEGWGYVPAFPGAQKQFRAAENGVRIDFITTGEFPGDGKPKPVAFPDPAVVSVEINGLRVIALERFIELKLASGMTNIHRGQDLVDVQNLIREVHLSKDLVNHLDASVRGEYGKLWQYAQMKDPLDG